MKTEIKYGFIIAFFTLSLIFCSLQLPPKCGKWRWDVKTITDKQGIALLTKSPVKSSISELVINMPPKLLYSSNHSHGNEPRLPSENQVVEIIAYVTKVKHESDDSDLHFILKSPDSENTMIGEIPDPACSTFDKFPVLRKHFTKTREDGATVWDQWKSSKRPVKVKITGVPFWDGVHSKKTKGASSFCREIHPILSIEIQ